MRRSRAQAPGRVFCQVAWLRGVFCPGLGVKAYRFGGLVSLGFSMIFDEVKSGL